MNIVLKTKNLKIVKTKLGEAIQVPLGFYLKDKILVNLTYMLDEDYYGIKKNTPLIWVFIKANRGYNDYDVIIPLADNIHHSTPTKPKKSVKLHALHDFGTSLDSKEIGFDDFPKCNRLLFEINNQKYIFSVDGEFMQKVTKK